MKMTCNGGASCTLQAAFEINISTLRLLERRLPRSGESVTDIKTEDAITSDSP